MSNDKQCKTVDDVIDEYWSKDNVPPELIISRHEMALLISEISRLRQAEFADTEYDVGN